ncbi:MAG: hypothetical protein H6708_27920 [Kofleriaceae bacterium]|nr:hypothetical protein [Kofleriaceae bacterium]
MPDFASLVSHAHWPAFVAGGAALVTTLQLAVWRRTRLARARVAAALAAPVTPRAAWVDGGDVVLRGTLRAERRISAIAGMGYAGGREQQELGYDAVDAAAIEVEGERVALGEPLAVVVGSHVIRHHELPRDRFEAASLVRDRVRRATELHLWRGGVDGYHERRIADGEQVLARGRLVRAAARPADAAP